MDLAQRDRSGMALRLDREHARRADQDVVDIAVAEARVVDHAPALARERLEQAAHLLLARGAALMALDEREDECDTTRIASKSVISEVRRIGSCSPSVRPRYVVPTASAPSANSVRRRRRCTIVRACCPAARMRIADHRSLLHRQSPASLGAEGGASVGTYPSIGPHRAYRFSARALLERRARCLSNPPK